MAGIGGYSRHSMKIGFVLLKMPYAKSERALPCLKSLFEQIIRHDTFWDANRAANDIGGVKRHGVQQENGQAVAVWISATRSGEGVSEVISQAVTTLCIQVPMLEIAEVVQLERKTAWGADSMEMFQVERSMIENSA